MVIISPSMLHGCPTMLAPHSVYGVFLTHAPSRSGIDYMLEAKLAEGRAQEAEQKVRGRSRARNWVGR